MPHRKRFYLLPRTSSTKRSMTGQSTPSPWTADSCPKLRWTAWTLVLATSDYTMFISHTYVLLAGWIHQCTGYRYLVVHRLNFALHYIMKPLPVSSMNSYLLPMIYQNSIAGCRALPAVTLVATVHSGTATSSRPK